MYIVQICTFSIVDLFEYGLLWYQVLWDIAILKQHNETRNVIS